MYINTELESALSANVEDWQDRWEELLRYLRALDQVNKTDYTKVFPELII